MTSETKTAPKHHLPVLLTIEQAAETLQLSTRTVRRLIDAGDLIAHRIGRGWRISQDDLRTFIRTRRQA
jgi:excisionase family DNA binding protein